MNDSWITEVHQELLRLARTRPRLGKSSRRNALRRTDGTGGAGARGLRPDCRRRTIARRRRRSGRLAGPPAAAPTGRWESPPTCRNPAGRPPWRFSSGRRRPARRDAQEKAVDWLLPSEGTTWNPDVGDQPYGHDPRLPAGPGSTGTHSWLEPTAMAVLALRRAGQAGHQRTRDGERLIRDRAIRSGGWNYGNSTVFGADLRPQPAPTGLALLALAGIDDFDSPLVARRCAISRGDSADHACSAVAVLRNSGAGRLGTTPRRGRRVADRGPRGAARRSNSVSQLAYLLLAAGSRALANLFGIAGSRSSRRELDSMQPHQRSTPRTAPRPCATCPPALSRSESAKLVPPTRLLTRRDLLAGSRGPVRRDERRANGSGTAAEHFRRREVVVARAESYGPHLVEICAAAWRNSDCRGSDHQREVGAAEAQPRRADRHGAADQHAPRARPRRGRGLPPLGCARGLRRRGPGALPRLRASSSSSRASDAVLDDDKTRVRRPEPRRRLPGAQPPGLHAACRSCLCRSRCAGPT